MGLGLFNIYLGLRGCGVQGLRLKGAKGMAVNRSHLGPCTDHDFVFSGGLYLRPYF